MVPGVSASVYFNVLPILMVETSHMFVLQSASPSSSSSALTPSDRVNDGEVKDSSPSVSTTLNWLLSTERGSRAEKQH